MTCTVDYRCPYTKQFCDKDFVCLLLSSLCHRVNYKTKERKEFRTGVRKRRGNRYGQSVI
jgi:hypothetical protein